MSALRHIILSVAGVAAAAWPLPPIRAQCRLCAQPTTALPTDGPNGDVELQIETTLNFDRLIVSGGGAGAATIRPDGTQMAEGGVVDLGPRAMVGTVLVHGEAGRSIRVDLPHRIQLYSIGGGRVTLDDIASDLPSLPRLDSAGNLTFRFGGRLMVSGDSDGQYRGDLPITVEYN
jgi:hypothetical protein